MQLFQMINFFQQFFNKFLPIIALILLVNIVYRIYIFTKAPEDKVALKAWYKKRVIWSSISFASIFVIWFFLGFLGSMVGIGLGRGGPALMIPPSGVSYYGDYRQSPGIPIPSNYYYNNQTSTIKDNREFEKISYNSTIKTRDVESVAKQVKLLIKGVSGRIDYSNISKTYATFTFVIPKKDFDDFDDTIRTYTHAKLYTETISSQNRLSEKQTLERNQDSAKETIATLSTQQQKVKNDYLKSANTLKAQIKTQTNDLASIKAELSVATTSEIIIPLQQRQSIVLTNISTLNDALANLTTRFKKDMSALGASLTQQDDVLSSLTKATDDFLDDIETVQGYVSINYVTNWELFTIYSPISPTWIIIILILAVILFNIISNHKKEKELLAMQS